MRYFRPVTIAVVAVRLILCASVVPLPDVASTVVLTESTVAVPLNSAVASSFAKSSNTENVAEVGRPA